jgi:hypothetical protein
VPTAETLAPTSQAPTSATVTTGKLLGIDIVWFVVILVLVVCLLALLFFCLRRQKKTDVSHDFQPMEDTPLIKPKPRLVDAMRSSIAKNFDKENANQLPEPSAASPEKNFVFVPLMNDDIASDSEVEKYEQILPRGKDGSEPQEVSIDSLF